MNKALTISFLSHAALLTLVLTVSFSRHNLVEDVYVVNLMSLPSPTSQITSINQPVSLIKGKNNSTITSSQISNTEQNLQTNKPYQENTFSPEAYKKSIESKLASIGQSLNKNRISSNNNSYKTNISNNFNKPLKNVLPITPFGQAIPNGYFAQIKNIIQQHWQIPQGNIYSNPAVISFRLWNDGTFSDIILETGSGIQRFDNSAIEAIKSVSRFPPFPEDLNSRYVDITITFTEGGIE